MQLIDGNLISQQILAEIKLECDQLPFGGLLPSITFIRVGDDPASVSYVNKKNQVASQLGFKANLIALESSISEDKLFHIIDDLNHDPSVNGILIQSPLPKHINEFETFNRVFPEKDVDGFTATNIGKIAQEDDSAILPCTPSGIVELLRRTHTQTEGKHVVIVGRSLIVGKPTALLLMRKHPSGNATVTVCHSKSSNLADITRSADILITAMGRPLSITANMVKKGAVVIDVGINRIADPSSASGYRLVGDVDFENVQHVASKITPVPGGVGPMTVAMLMKNTLYAFKLQHPLQHVQA